MEKYRHYILSKENFNREWLICDTPVNGDVIVWFGRTGSRLRKKVVKQSAGSPHQEIERRVRGQEKDGYVYQGEVTMRDKRPVPIGNANPAVDPEPKKPLMYWRYERDFSQFLESWLDVNEDMLSKDEAKIRNKDDEDVCTLSYLDEPEIFVGKEFIGGELDPEVQPVAFHMWLVLYEAFPFDISLTIQDEMVASRTRFEVLPGFNQAIAEKIGLRLKKVSFSAHFSQQKAAYF